MNEVHFISAPFLIQHFVSWKSHMCGAAVAIVLRKSDFPVFEYPANAGYDWGDLGSSHELLCVHGPVPYF